MTRRNTASNQYQDILRQLRELKLNACQAQYHVRYISMFDLMTEFAIQDDSPQGIKDYLKQLSQAGSTDHR